MTTNIHICRVATQNKQTNKDNFGTLWGEILTLY